MHLQIEVGTLSLVASGLLVELDDLLKSVRLALLNRADGVLTGEPPRGLSERRRIEPRLRLLACLGEPGS